MLQTLGINNIEVSSLKKKILQYGNDLDVFLFLDSSNFSSHDSKYSYNDYDFIAAIGCKEKYNNNSGETFEQLKKFNQTKDWIFGYFSYDLKNKIENLKSENLDELEFPELFFFIPEVTIVCKNKKPELKFNQQHTSETKAKQILKSILDADFKSLNEEKNIKINQRFSKTEYIDTVNKLKKHIQLGDIYEVNFCQEFYSKSEIDPFKTYTKLNNISPTPFSSYLKFDNNYLLSASPERFIKKVGSKVISQPIKGTARRGNDEIEDQKIKEQLFNDPKERAENVMIVDLVRNDLSRTAKKGSVKVDELFGVYTFKQVHQLISTISSEIDEETNIIDVIKNTFPMGSMTGAPKVRAMKLIEKYERTKRGLYSGAVGYITPENDFDFNVVIRSILYNQTKKYVSFTVGGAITSLADPEKEYEECLIKAKAMLDVLN